MSKILEFMPEQPKESKLAYRTCFSSLSYYGHKLDILKSGLQKYLRRREEEKREGGGRRRRRRRRRGREKHVGGEEKEEEEREGQ